MSTDTPPAGEGAALVIQRRIADEGYAPYSRWLGRVAERLHSWPGFLGQEVIAPAPPGQVDWVSIQRFADTASARAWLQSPERLALVEEIRGYFVGQEDMHLLADTGPPRQSAASAVITYIVAPEDEADFLEAQRAIQAREAEFPGFLRHKIERPVPGVHEEWIIILSFDSDEALTGWLESDVRKRMLAADSRFNGSFSLRRVSHGFEFWFRGKDTPASDPVTIFKSNLMVLLVLYPVVYLWGFFVGHPVLDGVPFWLALFIGNLFSTQLLGWWAVPKAFELFGWWLAPKSGLRREVAGYALLAVLYALSMAGYAGLLAWNWGHG